MEDSSDTPRVCEACGGESEGSCPWCSRGFQNTRQQEVWRQFRQRMSKISGTYSIFQGLIEGTIGLLEQMKDEEARSLALEGRDVLCRWLLSDHGSVERDEAGRGLVLFHNRSLRFLANR